MHRSMIWPLAVIAAVFATPLQALGDPVPPQTLLLGCAVSLTGSQAKEGRLTKEGYDFWQSYVNTHGGLHVGNALYRIVIHYRDDKS